MDIRLVYITCKDTDQARSIGQTLVRERLAACTNVLPGMESCYYWQGQLQTDQEAVLIAKTTADRYPLLEKRVKALHSYECPCIVALPVTTGFAPYLDWIRDSTKPGA